MYPWHKRFFETTRGRLVALLRRGSSTVDELASELGVTDNAVRAQLTTLERDGLVEQRGVRRGAGKPSHAYGLTAAFEPTLSRAYAPLLVQLLRELAGRFRPEELNELLRAVGRRWASELPATGGSAAERAAAAVALLEQLGGAVDLEQGGDDGSAVMTVRGFGCPVGLAVGEEPRVCAALETVLGAVTGMDVKECCERGAGAPRCRFELRDGAG
ncbi:MAG: helix-turn-helix transcriptional regulator [Gemmatimonadales bacterium]